ELDRTNRVAVAPAPDPGTVAIRNLRVRQPGATPLPDGPAAACDPSGPQDRWREASDSLPQAGTEFLGFHLIEVLGEGAFGRVYLARQGDLAGRLVALKVACDIADESQKLAQLQHT